MTWLIYQRRLGMKMTVYTLDKVFNAIVFQFEYFSSDISYQALLSYVSALCYSVCSKLSLEKKF